MSLFLDEPMQVGAAYVASLVRQHASGRAVGSVVVFAVTKRPEAVLILMDGETRAFEISGQPLALCRIKQLCPGAVEQLRRHAVAHS